MGGAILKDAHPDTPHGEEVGDNSSPGGQHDSRDPGSAGTNPLGMGGGGRGVDIGGPVADDPAVRTSDVLERFARPARARLKERIVEEYASRFVAFARAVDLEAYTKGQLAGRRGKELLLRYLQEIPRPSWRYRIVALKAVWTLGLELPWPLDVKRDLGRLPRPRRRETPPDVAVGEWSRALAHEPDAYNRLLWLLVAQHGWRPSHVQGLRWHHVRAGPDGRPRAIVADGLEAGFKTPAPVAARLAPEVALALEAWRREVKDGLPESPILPWRSAWGKVEPSRPLNGPLLRDRWGEIRERWKLPALRPVDLRHWVATACRRAGLSRQASAYLMGHDPAQGGAMRDWYDAPQLEDVLTEQAERLPRGPLALLEPPEVRLIDGVPPEILEVVRAYVAGDVGTMEMASRLEALRLKVLKGPTGLLEP